MSAAGDTVETPLGQTGDENEGEKNEDQGDEERAFECNICLDTAKDAVISMCGHLFW